jgi:Fur family transcriptional regulator, ferric uptake regulator
MRDYKEILEEYLKKQGKEYSKEAGLVADEVFEIHAHFTQDDLVNKLAQVKPELIEEILKDLGSAGLIRKIYFEDRVFYEQVYGHAHHDHMICIGCGKVEAFRDETIEKEQQRIAKEKGFEFLKHSMQIVGICPACQKKRAVKEKFEDQKEDKVFERGKIIPLSMIPAGEKVKIVELAVGAALVHRLRSMGVKVNQEIEVLNNNFHGPFLVKVQGSRIALGHGVTHRVLVVR